MRKEKQEELARYPLKPCPFCGNDVVWRIYSVVCTNCHFHFCPIHSSGYVTTQRIWNSRVSDDYNVYKNIHERALEIAAEIERDLGMK